MIVIVGKFDGHWTAELVNGPTSLVISFAEEWMAKSYATDLAETIDCELSVVENTEGA